MLREACGVDVRVGTCCPAMLEIGPGPLAVKRDPLDTSGSRMRVPKGEEVLDSSCDEDVGRSTDEIIPVQQRSSNVLSLSWVALTASEVSIKTESSAKTGVTSGPSRE